MLPKQEDGVFRADAFDVIDEKNRLRRVRGLMKDMGYSDKEIDKIEEGAGGSEKDSKKKDPDIVKMPKDPKDPRRADVINLNDKRKG